VTPHGIRCNAHTRERRAWRTAGAQEGAERAQSRNRQAEDSLTAPGQARSWIARPCGTPSLYRIGCEWQRFVRKPVVGVDSKECYTARYDGEGIVCWLDDPQHGGEYDASLPYEAVQKALTGCLPGWKYEETSKAKVHSDRAFSLSKVVEDGAGKSVQRVQACLFTQPPRDLDEPLMKLVRIEAFAEPVVRSADGGTR